MTSFLSKNLKLSKKFEFKKSNETSDVGCPRCDRRDILYTKDNKRYRCKVCMDFASTYGGSRLKGKVFIVTENATHMYVGQKTDAKFVADTELATHHKAESPIKSGFRDSLYTKAPYALMHFSSDTILNPSDVITTMDIRRISTNPYKVKVSSPIYNTQSRIITQFNGEVVRKALEFIEGNPQVLKVEKRIEVLCAVANGLHLENKLVKKAKEGLGNVGVYDMPLPHPQSQEMAALCLIL